MRERKETDSDYISPVNDTTRQRYCACVSEHVFTNLCVCGCVCVCAFAHKIVFVCLCIRTYVCVVFAAPVCVMPEDMRAVIEWW